MTTLSITTFNVNSINARLPNVLAWLDSAKPDVVLLQELKCVDEAFPRLEIEQRGYQVATHGQKTYNGVAILSKHPLEDVTRGLPNLPLEGGGGRDVSAEALAKAEATGGGAALQSHSSISTPTLPVNDKHLSFTPLQGEEDSQARYIEGIVCVGDARVRVASAYVPNGQDPASDKFAYKLKFYDRLYAHWCERMVLDETAVLGGDFNCAPAPLDVYDAKHLDGTVCYHPEERKRLRALMHLGLYDAFRLKHPAEQQFSWWDYRGDGYGRNLGLRIDHLLCSARAADVLSECIIDEVPRQQEKPSDHAPVTATLLLQPF